jgi:hypothetical protein
MWVHILLSSVILFCPFINREINRETHRACPVDLPCRGDLVGVAVPGAEAVIMAVRKGKRREGVAAALVQKECGHGGRG